MNRVRLLALGATLLAALATLAQQTSPKPASQAVGDFPSVDAQMKVLTQKLDLTADQQSKIRPIMQDLHDYTEKLLQDPTLSTQERLDQVRPRRIEAGKKIRVFLTEEQNSKFDAYLRGPHRDMHGGLSGNGAGAALPK